MHRQCCRRLLLSTRTTWAWLETSYGRCGTTRHTAVKLSSTAQLPRLSTPITCMPARILGAVWHATTMDRHHRPLSVCGWTIRMLHLSLCSSTVLLLCFLRGNNSVAELHLSLVPPLCTPHCPVLCPAERPNRDLGSTLGQQPASCRAV